MVSVPEPAMAFVGDGWTVPSGASARASDQMRNLELARDMESASCDGMPNDVLIVEDDPIIALDFEDTFLALG
jgi:hypothetical protein